MEVPRPSLEGSVWGWGGDGRATPGDKAGAPARGSLGPETQSQLRKGRSGARGSGPGEHLPLRAARPPAPAGAAAARQEHAGPTGRGWGPFGCTTPQRPASGTRTRDPRPTQAGGRLAPPEARVQLGTSSGPELLDLVSCRRCPSLHPELRDTQARLDPWFGLWNPGPQTPPSLTLRPWSLHYRDVPGLWEWVHLSPNPSLPGTRGRPLGGPGSPGPDPEGTWPGRAGPRPRAPPLSPFKRFLPLCPAGGLHLH